MATVNIQVAMHCPAGKATFKVTGDAKIKKISCAPSELPGCTVSVCTPTEITIRDTRLDQGPNSDHVSLHLEVYVGNAPASATIGCDGPGKASAWFKIEGSSRQYSCPPGLGLNNAGSTAQLEVSGE